MIGYYPSERYHRFMKSVKRLHNAHLAWQPGQWYCLATVLNTLHPAERCNVMWQQFTQKILNRLQLREAWVIFFVLGNVMINFPFLRIFNQPISVIGYPVLFIYFTVGWAISIFVVYLFTLTVDEPEQAEKPEEQA